MKKIILSVSLAIAVAACNNNKTNHDASGVFETTETIIAAEANGIIKRFDLQEGQVLNAGQYIGYIDTVQLHLKKKQLESQVRSLRINRTPHPMSKPTPPGEIAPPASASVAATPPMGNP